ncbi:MAG: SMP-30/gluconolactonase/LRE family protein [Verrucomicrobia bacterium]|nr:SMP-30/gluconolactonase/LRE family protein [Verrucomicrobiota bacterium]
MKKFLILALLPLSAMAADDKPHPFVGKIERLDSAFDKLVAPGAQIEKLAEGFRWSEGPTWYQGAVVFSDVLANTAYRWKEGMTAAEVFLQPSGQLTPAPGFRETGSNGLGRDARGRLLLCQHGERRVARWENGKFSAIADRFEGKRFNSPNDLAVRRNGDIYFTDPPYGLEGIAKSPLRELDFSGVFRVTPDGRVTLLTKSLNFPNGLGFSPDEKTVYVAVSDGAAPRIMAYDVKADGSLEKERVFLNAAPLRGPGLPGSCDGLKVDREGNVWATGPGGVLVLSPAGKVLGRLNTGEPTGNCCWGDDGSTLYITANYFLVRVKTLTKGAGW